MEAATDPEARSRSERARFWNSAILPIVAIAVIWCIHFIDSVYALHLSRFGILPREAKGLIGIFASPLLHGDLQHLFNNTLPILFLGWGLMYFYPRIAGKVVIAAWIGAGTLVWIMARPNFHIGASGVIYGMAAFLFTSGLLRRQRTLMALSLLIVFLYGSMVWGIFPLMPRISWEGHLCGMIAGVAIAFIYKHVPPAVSDPRPIHFDEDEEHELIGSTAEPTASNDPLENDDRRSQIDRTGPIAFRSSDSWSDGNAPADRTGQ